ncbi:MAG: hypothetical protein WC091_21210 [Sulfuricellaceae bacterium]
MFKALLLLACCASLCSVPTSAVAAYTVKVAVAFPKGSAGEKPLAKYPTSTKISPCDNAALPTFNAATFTVTYDATNSKKVVDRDVYIILFNPEGMSLPKFFLLKKNNLGSNFTFTTHNDAWEISKTDDIYLPRPENLSTVGAQTETLLGGSISVQAVNSGIWQLIGIIADSTNPKLDFDDPRTWDAWDVATLMLRKPWNGNSNRLCGA